MIHPRIICPNNACKSKPMPVGARFCPFCGSKLVQVFDQDQMIEDVLWLNDMSLDMVKVEGGEFYLGGKQHLILNDFYIGKYLVTRALWCGVMGEKLHPAKGKMPMEGISWEMAQAFVHKLNELTNKMYRLPTEAEWEFAAKGGLNTRGYWYAGGDNLTELGWFELNSDYEVHEVGLKKPNELDLYDMSGNVWECCDDAYEKHAIISKSMNAVWGQSSPTSKVCRGGSCFDWQESAQVEYRRELDPLKVEARLGLRLAMNPEFCVIKL